MSDDLIVDLDDVTVEDHRYCEIEFNGRRFGLRYDAEQMKTPALLMLFEKSRRDAEDQRVREAALEKLEARALQAEGEGLSKDEAMAKARRILPVEAKQADTRTDADLASSAKALSQLVVWIGLRAGGKLVEPTEQFFLDRVFEFHTAVFEAILEDFNRPTNASMKDSRGISSLGAASVSNPSDGAASVLHGMQAEAGATTTTI